MVKIVECPRDAMQGISKQIPTQLKIDYLNLILKVGFDTIDFGSFVSPKAIPQMADTRQVLVGLDLDNSNSHLLAIVANLRGAQEAVEYEQIKFLGYPMSISETFQQRNTNKSIAESLNILQEIQNLCVANAKKLVVYISMGFGNPYGDVYNDEIVLQFAQILTTLGVEVVSLADTVGNATSKEVGQLYSKLVPELPDVELGVHLHSTPEQALEKVQAAYDAGCRRFDGAIRGFGGCPMADDELIGNIATETIHGLLWQKEATLNIDKTAFEEALSKASEVFG